MNLGDPFPNFTATTTQGVIDFHDWIGESWVVLFSHPAGEFCSNICMTKYCPLMISVLHNISFEFH